MRTLDLATPALAFLLRSGGRGTTCDRTAAYPFLIEALVVFRGRTTFYAESRLHSEAEAAQFGDRLFGVMERDLSIIRRKTEEQADDHFGQDRAVYLNCSPVVSYSSLVDLLDLSLKVDPSICDARQQISVLNPDLGLTLVASHDLGFLGCENLETLHRGDRCIDTMYHMRKLNQIIRGGGMTVKKTGSL